MEYRSAGNSGLAISALGLGCVSIGRRPDEPGKRLLAPEIADAVIGTAIDEGITLFDTADTYGDSEVAVGAALRSRRDEVVIATKFGYPLRDRSLGADYGRRGARSYIIRAVERSLSRLGTDRIDLYQMHGPDPITPVDETLSALDQLIASGKVRYIGCSNTSAWQLAEASWTARTRNLAPFSTVQNQYNLLAPAAAAELTSACARYGVGIIAYCPLANGLLTGRYRRGNMPAEHATLPAAVASASLDRVEAIRDFAEASGISLVEVALGALLDRQTVSSVIAGATSPEQVRANVRAAAWRPNPEQAGQIRKILNTTPSWPQAEDHTWRKDFVAPEGGR